MTERYVVDTSFEPLTASDAAKLDSCVFQPQQIRLVKRKAWANVGMLLLKGLLCRIIRTGTLTVVAPDGTSYDFGNDSPAVTVRITDWAVVWRLSLDPDLAIGEAYMDGTLVVSRSKRLSLLDLP